MSGEQQVVGLGSIEYHRRRRLTQKSLHQLLFQDSHLVFFCCGQLYSFYQKVYIWIGTPVAFKMLCNQVFNVILLLFRIGEKTTGRT